MILGLTFPLFCSCLASTYWHPFLWWHPKTANGDSESWQWAETCCCFWSSSFIRCQVLFSYMALHVSLWESQWSRVIYRQQQGIISFPGEESGEDAAPLCTVFFSVLKNTISWFPSLVLSAKRSSDRWHYTLARRCSTSWQIIALLDKCDKQHYLLSYYLTMNCFRKLPDL